MWSTSSNDSYRNPVRASHEQRPPPNVNLCLSRSDRAGEVKGVLSVLILITATEDASYGGDKMKPRTVALFVGTGFFLGTLPYMSLISQTHARMSSADALMQRHNEAETRELEGQELKRRELEKQELERQEIEGQELKRRELERRSLLR